MGYTLPLPFTKEGAQKIICASRCRPPIDAYRVCRRRVSCRRYVARCRAFALRRTPLLSCCRFQLRFTAKHNNAVRDRTLRPRCCHLGSYLKRPKSSPVRPLAGNWYYCTQFIAKPKAACALRFNLAATFSNLGL